MPASLCLPATPTYEEQFEAVMDEMQSVGQSGQADAADRLEPHAATATAGTHTHNITHTHTQRTHILHKYYATHHTRPICSHSHARTIAFGDFHGGVQLHVLLWRSLLTLCAHLWAMLPCSL